MIIKVVLCVSDNGTYFPPQIPQRLINKEYPYCRMGDVVETITKEGLTNIIPTMKISKQMLNNLRTDRIYRLTSSKEFYYVKRKDTEQEAIYRIVSVDTNKPWRIKKLGNGNEKIEYFAPNDKFKVLDVSLNYAEKVD